MTDTVPMTLGEVHALTTEIFRAHGVSADQTRALADVISSAERDECRSHGLFRIPAYLKAVNSGRVCRDAVPELTQPAPGVVRVDAHLGFAPLALEMGLASLIDASRKQGVAALAVVNAHHFAALWPEVEAVAEQGLVAFAFLSNSSFVAPPGGNKRLFGTNPMAFAWPRPGKPPILFDQASSASARGEILLRQRAGEKIPAGWAIGANGEPTTEPVEALAGAQLPFGGHKGGAIALMIELLAGPLVGDVLSYEATEKDPGDGGPVSGGEFMMAIDPARCSPRDNRQRQLLHAERLFERILAQPGTRLPSDRRYAARARTRRDGIHVPRGLYDDLQPLRKISVAR